MPSQHSGTDLVAYDRDGHVLLLVEAKSRRGTTESWAAGLRRNMLSHGLLPWSKYFLIATPERMYLWKQQQPNAPETPPELTIDAEKVLQPYFQRLHQEPSSIGPEAFEHLLLTWLTDIAGCGDSTAPDRNRNEDASSTWLSELSGSLQEARIEMNPPQ